MDKLNPKNEPIMSSTVAVVIAWVSTRFALGMDAGTVTAVSAVVFVVAQYVARNFSIPTRKHDKVVKEVIAAKEPTA